MCSLHYQPSQNFPTSPLVLGIVPANTTTAAACADQSKFFQRSWGDEDGTPEARADSLAWRMVIGIPRGSSFQDAQMPWPDHLQC